jgi:hypothetical protein
MPKPNPLNIKFKYAVIPLILSIFIGAELVLFFKMTPQLDELPPYSNSKEQEKFLINIINKVGPDEAWRYFKEQNKKQPLLDQHANSHIFGDVLYKTTGISGITVCDDTFGFGCFHQFFLSAIADKGVEVVPEIDQACIEKFTPGGQGCQHGVGHGLVEYLGRDIVAALNICAGMSWQKPLFGCQSGVFMEYNFPSFVDEAGNRPVTRKFYPEKPYEFCNGIPERFKPACYYYEAEWWLKGGLNFTNTEIGNLCAEIRTDNFRKMCFAGLGYSSVDLFGFNLGKAIAVCSDMPNNEYVMFCRSGIHWGFEDNRIYPLEVERSCRDMAPELTEACRENGKLLSKGDIL